MLRTYLIAVVFVVATALSSAAEATRVERAIENSRQLLVVTSDNWSANRGTLALLERGSEGEWRPVLADVPVMLGRNGLAWGVGLHPQLPTKREGDGRAPAGVFELDTIYGRDAVPPSVRFPFQQLSDTMEGIDDSRSRWYNRLVDGSKIEARDWTRSEKVRASNPMFRWCVTVKHNWEQRPDLGSCIYLHIWKAPGVATAGCTAMDAAALERVVRWLDARKRPLLIQFPRGQYPAVEAVISR